MDRATFLALLARLNGEGEALTADEFASMQAYIAEHRGDSVAITDDELVAVDEACRALADDDDATTELLIAAADVADLVVTVTGERETAAAEAEAEREAARARLRGDDPAASDTGTDGDDAEGETEGEGDAEGETTETADEGEGDADAADDSAAVEQPVAAAAAASRARAPQQHRRTGGAPRARTQARRGARIVRDGGGEFESLTQLGQAMIDRRESMLSFGGSGSGADKLVVGSIRYDYPDERVLDPRNPVQSLERMDAVIAAMTNANADELDAVTAAGGLCAPLETLYGIPRLGDTDRPMRASFQQFNAGRGGIVFRDPLDMPDWASAVEVWTAANDADPGGDGPATKPCLEVTCPGTNEARIYAVTECLQFGNFLARTDPEMVRQATEETAVAFARKAETKLLDLTKAASTAVTAGTALGAFRDLAYYVGVAAAGFRSRFRLRRDALVEVRFPGWIYDMAREDIARSLPAYPDQLAVADDVLNRMFALRNVRVAALYLDSPTTGTSQVFADQTASALLDFPDQVQWHMTHPGSFLLLDNGRLDLGVIRDSDLVATNDYKTFAETFEGLAFTGLASYWVTQDICASGASSGTVSPEDLCSGAYVP